MSSPLAAMTAANLAMAMMKMNISWRSEVLCPVE
jgi:hypothetical protein